MSNEKGLVSKVIFDTRPISTEQRIIRLIEPVQIFYLVISEIHC
jgi:hypothetical protein